MTMTTEPEAGPTGPDTDTTESAASMSWVSAGLTLVGTLVTIVGAVRLQFPSALLVPGVLLVVATGALIWYRFGASVERRRRSPGVVPAAACTAAVSVAVLSALVGYDRGAVSEDGEHRDALRALRIDNDRLRTENRDVDQENGTFRRNYGDLQERHKDLQARYETLLSTGKEAPPSPAPSGSSTPTPAPGPALPGPQGAPAATYTLDLTHGSYYDFDTRDASLEPTPQFEVQMYYGDLRFGERTDTWHDVEVVHIDSSATSAEGCAAGTKLQTHLARLSRLEQDESVCISTTGGDWAVLKPAQAGSSSFHVQVF